MAAETRGRGERRGGRGRLARRSWLRAVGGVAFAGLLRRRAEGASVLPKAGTWRVGMSAALSGPASSLGRGMKAGLEAAFADANARGGVSGRAVELVALDDGYEPGRAGANMRRLIDEEHVLAVIGNTGTPTAAVTVPIANEKQVPLFGALTGAGLLRKTPPDRYVLNFRASYAEETAEMVRGLVQELHVPPDRIAFFTQNDAYGDSGFLGAVKALERIGYARAAQLPHGRYPRNTIDVEEGLARLLDPRLHPAAIIVVGAYKPCARFISLARQEGLRALFLNVSFVGSEALARELGHAGEGVVVTQVVPHFDADLPVTRAYRELVPPEERTFISLEGYLVGRAFLAGLAAVGPSADAESWVNAMEGGVPLDLGLGQPLRVSRTQHQLSHTVWPTVIRRGRFESLARWTDLGARS